MRASTYAQVRPGGVLGPLRCEPPLTLRRVLGPTGTCALCLVGSAAGPLPGDDLALHLDLDAGAHATLAATGATIAQGRGAAPASLVMTARLGAGAALHADPGPLVVAGGAHVDVAVALELAADAVLEWRELIVLGRTHDASPGTATVRWDVSRAGHPVLRQQLDLPGAALAAGHRVTATALITGPQLRAQTLVASPTAVAQRVDAHTVLITVLAAGAADANARLGELRTELIADAQPPASLAALRH